MSNSKLLSNVASNLANSSGKILTVANGKIVWSQNYAFDAANNASSNTIIIQGINDTQNTNISSAFVQANTGVEQAQAAFSKANSSITLGSTPVYLGSTNTNISGLTLTNPVIDGFTGNTGIINIGSAQIYKDVSGNVGIGTSSLGNRFVVYSGAGTASYAEFVGNNAPAGALYVGQDATGLSRIFQVGAKPITFWTNGVERLSINSVGDIGIGSITTATSPIAGSLSAAGIISASGYLNSHQTSKAVLQLNDDTASLRVYGSTAGSGNLTFNVGGGGGSADFQAMSLNNNGDLFVGDYTATIYSSRIKISNNTSSNNVLGVANAGAICIRNSAFSETITGALYLAHDGAGNGIVDVTRSTGSLIFATNNTERLRIDASGNVGIGTTTINHKVDISGSLCVDSFADTTNNYISLRRAYTPSGGGGVGFKATDHSGANADGLACYGHDGISLWTAQTERLRIDPSGNLFLNCTSNPMVGFGQAKLTVHSGSIDSVNLFGSSSANILNLQRPFGYTNGTMIAFSSINSGGSTSSQVGSITISGSTTTYATSSDYRLKENVKPIQNALNSVDALNPVTFDWKIDGSKGQGFIAHELQDILPDCVVGEKDGEQMQCVDYGKLTPILVAAIQELTQRIKQLESK